MRTKLTNSKKSCSSGSSGFFPTASKAVKCLGLFLVTAFVFHGEGVQAGIHVQDKNQEKAEKKIETKGDPSDNVKDQNKKKTDSSAVSNSSDKQTPNSVGIKGTIKTVILPFAGIKAKPINPADKVIVRIAGSWKDAAGGRYELEYFGLEKGEYDLADYLVVPEGADKAEMPKIPVTVTSIVPEQDFLVGDLKAAKLPDFGYYWVFHLGAYLIWFLGLVVILIWGWRPKGKKQEQKITRPPTWAETLRPLFQAAQSGDLTAEQQAELERMLITFWRDKLDLSGVPASIAMEKLSDDPTAGPSVKKLEQWIHSPADRRPKEDVESLLIPYQQLIQTGQLPKDQNHAKASEGQEAKVSG